MIETDIDLSRLPKGVKVIRHEISYKPDSGGPFGQETKAGWQIEISIYDPSGKISHFTKEQKEYMEGLGFKLSYWDEMRWMSKKTEY